jgi:large conductance mechanosensitive channel
VLQEFKKFILKGNLVQLAVAFVLGIAFAAVVTSFTDDIVMAIVGAIVGKPNFNSLTLEIGDGVIYYGRFLTAVVNFVIIGFVLFLVVKAYDSAATKMGFVKDEDGPTDNDLLKEIRDLLRDQQRSG